jgi:CheY-like chemotaxis protein
MIAELASILLVEDDPGDVMLIREALVEHKVGNALSVVSDGVQAMEFVRGLGAYQGVERPDLVLLDLNLPRKSGAEVLAEIKGDPELSMIPVVVLTTSESEDDVLRSYQRHANAYITKPLDFERFRDIVRQIDDFFIGIVKLPPHGTSADGA